jgi:RNA polymerase sigma factor (sigma-70 family)
MDDQFLLQQFVEEGSQTAFSELVQRYIDLVYSAALRQTGNAHRAQDVTQNVFLALSAKAESLRRRTDLAGWLYISTRHAARALGRAEARRERAQQLAAHVMTPPTVESDDTTWERIKPDLDRLLCELTDEDRRAVLLRYFHQQPYADVAAALGLSEEATRKRVDRALDRLHIKLERLGVRSSTAALGALLLGNGLVSAPIGLGAAIVQSLGGLAGATALLPGLTLFMTSTKTIVLAAAVAIAAGTGGWFVGRSAHHDAGDRVGLAQGAKSPDASNAAAAAPSGPAKKQVIAPVPGPSAPTPEPVKAGGFTFQKGAKTKAEIQEIERKNLTNRAERMDMLFSALYRQLNFDESQKGQLMALKVKEDYNSGRLVQAALLKTAKDPAARSEAIAAAKDEAQAAYLEEVKATFGESVATTIANYETALPTSYIVNRMTAPIAATNEPLSPEQISELGQIVSRSSRDASGRVNPSALNTGSVLSAAQSILSPTQFAELRQLEASGVLSAPLSNKDFEKSKD